MKISTNLPSLIIMRDTLEAVSTTVPEAGQLRQQLVTRIPQTLGSGRFDIDMSAEEGALLRDALSRYPQPSAERQEGADWLVLSIEEELDKDRALEPA